MHPQPIPALVALSIAATASAQVLEDFEHANPSLWPPHTGGGSLPLVSLAAHSGALGARFDEDTTPWWVRTDLATAPGNTYSAYVRFHGPHQQGRIYLGVGASPAGTCSAVLAANTNDLHLEINQGYAHQPINTVPFTPSLDTWYVLSLEWALNGALTARLYDESMTLLAATGANYFGFTTPGGLAIRGFTYDPGFENHMDDITVHAHGCYADCNQDGQRSIADFGCFQTRWVSFDPYGDCDLSALFTVADFACFQTAFVAGCP